MTSPSPAQLDQLVQAMQPAVGGPPLQPPPPPSLDPAMGGQSQGIDLGALLGTAPGQPPPAQPKPPLLLPPNLARQLAQGYVEHAREVAHQVANYAGPPDEYQRFGLKDQVQAYYKRDLRQDPMALKEQGLSDIEIRDKVYPLRRILLKMSGPEPADRVKFAQQMKSERRKLDMLSKGESF